MPRKTSKDRITALDEASTSAKKHREKIADWLSLEFPNSVFACAPYMLLVAAVLLAYANVYHNTFLYDDVDLIVHNAFLRHWTDLPELLTGLSLKGANLPGGFYRPFLMLLYLFTYQMFGLSAVAFHVLNIALHVANTCLVCRLGGHLGLRKWFSFSAALLWGVHPLLTEAVTFMSCTADPLYSLFCLLGLVILLPDFAPRKFWLSSLLFALALASKESAVIFPALVTITLFLVSNDRLRPATYFRTWPLWLLTVVFVTGWVTYIYASDFHAIHIHSDVYTRFYAHNLTNRLVTCLATLPIYFGLMIWPVCLHLERSFLIFVNPWDWRDITGAAMVTGVILQMGWGRGRRGLALSWGFLWFAVAYSPNAGVVVPTDALIFEHWMYLPTVGVAVGAARSLQIWLGRLPKRATMVASVLVVLAATVLVAKTHVQNQVWRDPSTFNENIFRCGERSGGAHSNLGIYYLAQGEFDKAIEQFNIAIAYPEMLPTSKMPYEHLNLAFAYLRVRLDVNGVSQDPIKALKQSLPFSSQIPEAIEELNEALELAPNFYLANKALAVIYAYQGNSEKASFYNARAEADSQEVVNEQ